VIARADPHRTVWMAALIAVGMAAINASLNHWQLAHSTAYVHGMSNGSIFGSAIFFIRSTLYYTAVLSAISWLAGHWPARISDFTQVGAYPAG